MKKILLICFLVSIFLGITIGGNATTKYMWNTGSCKEGSSAYTAIGILSEVVNTYAGDYVFMTPIPYSKSLVGLRGFDQKEVVSMVGSSMQFDQIINKWGPFSPDVYKWTAPYVQMMWMYDLDYALLIRKKDADKIKSWSDLAYRPIFPQMFGTGGYEFMKMAFGPDGLNIWDTIDKKAFQRTHCADALKLGEVDAVFAYGAGGNWVAFVQEVLARVDCVFLCPTPEELEKITKSYKYIFPVEVTLGGQDLGYTKTVKFPALGYVYMVDPNVSEEIVYQVTKVVFERAEEMAESTPIWENFSKDPFGYNLPYLLQYKKLGVPIHPGVLRYFRELGHDTKALGLE